MDTLKAFGHDTVCIDTTHGTNMYHFNLITLVVIDEYVEGIPVASMLSNREDAISLIPFFAPIKGISGVILHHGSFQMMLTITLMHGKQCLVKEIQGKSFVPGT